MNSRNDAWRNGKLGAGFTLLETVITVALTVVIMLAIANLYINFNTLYIYQQSYTATTNAAASAMSAIDGAVLPADLVVASHAFPNGTFSTGTASLVLEVPSVNASGTIVTNAYDYIGFYLSGTDLYRTIDANAASVRATGVKRVAPLVSSIAFGYDTAVPTQAATVFATTTTALSTKKGLVQTTLHEQVVLRNR